LEGMLATTSLLQQQIGSTFQGALSDALQSLAMNTASLGDAVRGFLLSMAEGLAQMASQALSQEAWARMLALFNQRGDGGAEAEQTAAAAATAAAATALSTAAGVVTSG